MTPTGTGAASAAPALARDDAADGGADVDDVGPERSARPDGVAFDATAPWALDERVALRPERFGALAYHFGTRRLSFLKSPTLLRVVRALADHPSAREACLAECADELDARRHERALATLAATDMIRPRRGDEHDAAPSGTGGDPAPPDADDDPLPTHEVPSA